MPLRDWAKRHIRKKSSKDQKPSTDDSSENDGSPTLKVFRSDTLGTTPVDIPTTGNSNEKAPLTVSAPSSPKPSKGNRLSLIGARHRSHSQNSLPDWNPPDDSDPNAERDWEARATKLAKLRPISITASSENLADLAKLSIKDAQPPRTSPDGHLFAGNAVGLDQTNMIDGLTSDDALQEAIRLHEAGGMPS